MIKSGDFLCFFTVIFMNEGKRITKVMSATNKTIYAQWRSPYITFIGDGYSIYACGAFVHGTAYAYWYNDFGKTVTATITVTVNGDEAGEDDKSSANLYLNPSKSWENGRILKVEDWWGGDNTSSSITATIPPGYYLTFFNQCDSQTWITVKCN